MLLFMMFVAVANNIPSRAKQSKALLSGLKRDVNLLLKAAAVICRKGLFMKEILRESLLNPMFMLY